MQTHADSRKIHCRCYDDGYGKDGSYIGDDDAQYQKNAAAEELEAPDC